MANDQDNRSNRPPAPPTISPVQSTQSPSRPTPVPSIAPSAPRGPSGVFSGKSRPRPFPEAGAVEVISPAQAAQLRSLAEGLNSFDYFEMLELSQTAAVGELKKAFYRESRTYHPDRFFHLPDSPVKTDISSIYKRITEAYYVLRDDAKRKKYIADIASAERNNKLRYTDATEAEMKAETRKTVEEEFGTNPKSRPFFKTAIAELEKQNWGAAERALKMGLTYEPGNTRFKEKLAEVQKQLEEQRRAQGHSFLIK